MRAAILIGLVAAAAVVFLIWYAQKEAEARAATAQVDVIGDWWGPWWGPWWWNGGSGASWPSGGWWPSGRHPHRPHPGPHPHPPGPPGPHPHPPPTPGPHPLGPGGIRPSGPLGPGGMRPMLGGGGGRRH